MRREERIQEDTSAPEGLRLGHALIERTALAIEAEFREERRRQAAADLYLSLVREVFAVTDDGSDETCPSTDPSSVRANAPGDAVSRPASGGLP